MRFHLVCAVLLLGLSSAVVHAKPAQSTLEETKPIEVPTTTIIPAEDVIPETDAPLAEPPAEDALFPEEAQPVVSEETKAETFNGPLPEVIYDTSLLPRPVARMRSQLMDAALSGDVERLRMVFESNEMPPTLSLAEIGDPIEFLKESSGDGEGREVLAILADVLDAGFVHVDAGTSQEMWVWPYFARYPLSELTPSQKVEMFRIITSGEASEMELYGVWLFYRVGIGPDGTLHYFVAGE